jgi:hypothetical protein
LSIAGSAADHKGEALSTRIPLAHRRGVIPDSRPKLSEFEVFASGWPEIGHNNPAAKLYAQTLPRDV